MEHESGSRSWRTDEGPSFSGDAPDDWAGQKWFDWWRIVTAMLTVLFLAGSVLPFSEVDDQKRQTAECKAWKADLEGGANYWCADEAAEIYTVVGLYLLAVAACFGAATLLRSGGSARRVFTTIGVTLVLLAASVYGLLILAYAVSINAQ